MSDPLISVVLCTYNPRNDYLQRCVDGLRKQTLDQTAWELVVVDNNSQPAVRLIRPKDQEPERSGTADSPKANSARRSRGQTKSPKDAQSEQAVEIDLSWHPRARIVVETQQGLSHARRRAFGEAKGDLIVNLDDDAVLDKDYLSQVVALAERLPLIGAFGCQIRPEFEQKPDWPVEEYYGAQRAVPQAVWSNDPTHYASNPWGVGSVVRREVAEAYVGKLATDQGFAKLGRSAGSLLACEDDDIAMTACDLGLGKGVFPELGLTHLIPTTRMTEDFLCRNARGHAYSGTVLEFLRFGRQPVKPTLQARLNRAYRLACMKSRRRRQELARDEGLKDAIRDMKQWGWF